MKYRICKNNIGRYFVEFYNTEYCRWEPVAECVATSIGIKSKEMYFYTLWGAERYIKKLIKQHEKEKMKYHYEIIKEIEP